MSGPASCISGRAYLLWIIVAAATLQQSTSDGFCYWIRQISALKSDQQNFCLSNYGRESILAWPHSSDEYNHLQTMLANLSAPPHSYWLGSKFDAATSNYLFGNNVATQASDWDVPGNKSGSDCVLLTNDWGNQTEFKLKELSVPECDSSYYGICKVPCTTGSEVPTLSAATTLQPSETLQLSCATIGTVSNFGWVKDGQILNETGSSSNLTVPPPYVPGLYQFECLALKGDGKYVKSGPVNTTYIETPVIQASPDETDFSTGTPVTLTCSTTMTLNGPIYRWYRRDSSGTIQLIGMTTDTLQVDDATLNDYNNEYTCEYDLPSIGTSNQATHPVKFFLGPAMPVVKLESSKDVYAYESVTLSCSNTTVLDGLPTYTWYADGFVVIGKNDVFITTSDKPATIAYTCMVTDDQGNSTISLAVPVTYKLPSVYNYTNAAHTYCYMIKEGPFTKTEAEISCSADGLASYLLNFYSSTEFDFVKGLMETAQKSSHSYWVQTDTIYAWEDGTTVPDSYWKDPMSLGYTGSVHLTNNWGDSSIFRLDETVSPAATAGAICKYPCHWTSITLASSAGNQVEPTQDTILTCSDTGEGKIFKFFDDSSGSFSEKQSEVGNKYSSPAPNSIKVINYMCAVIQENGEYGLMPSFLTVTYIESPTIVVTPVDPHNLHVYSTGTMVTLTCSTTLTPSNPTFEWSVSNMYGTDDLPETGFQLMFTDTDFHHSYLQNTLRCSYQQPGVGHSNDSTYSMKFTEGPPRPNVISADPATVEARQSVILTCSGSSVGFTTAMWYVDGVFDSTATTTSFTVTSDWPKVIKYSCKLVDSRGNSTVSASYDVTYTLPPVYNFAAVENFCYTLYSGVSVNKEDAQDSCSSLGMGSSLALFHTESEFDNLKTTMEILTADDSEFWVDSLVKTNEYYFGNSTVNSQHFTDLIKNPPTQCVAISNIATKPEFLLKELAYGCDSQLGYLCRVICEGDTQGSPPRIIVSDSSLVTGTDLDVECIPSFPHSNIIWYIDGSKVATTVETKNTFTSPPMTTARNYSCSAVGVNGAFIVSSEVWVVYLEQPVLTVSPHGNLRRFSSDTELVLTCHLTAYPDDAVFYWYKDGSLMPSTEEYSLEIDESGASSKIVFHYKCYFEIPDGKSPESTELNLTITPGPRMPDITASSTTWVRAGDNVTFTCRNTSVLVGAATYIWYVNGFEIEDETSFEFVNTSLVPMTALRYMCKVKDTRGPSTESHTKSQLYAVAEMCIPDLCQNYGVCYAVDYNTSACRCAPGFEGTYCEKVIVKVIAETFDFSEMSKGLVAVDEILVGMSRDLMANLTIDKLSRIALSSDVITIYTQRLMKEEADNWEVDSLAQVTEKTMAKSEEIIGLLQEINCTQGVETPLCDNKNVEQIFRGLETAIYDMGVATLRSKSGSTYSDIVQSGNITMTLAKLDVHNTKKFDTFGANITIPDTMASAVKNSKVFMVALNYDSDPYFHTNTTFRAPHSVYAFCLKDDSGMDLPIDPDDPVRIQMEPLPDLSNNTTENYTSEGMHKIPLSDMIESAVMIEMGISSSQVLYVKGQMDVEPTDFEFEFHIKVNKLRQLEIYNNTPSGNNNYEFHLSNNFFLKILCSRPNGTTLYLLYGYNDTSLPIADYVETTLSVYAFFVNYWDTKAVSWAHAKGYTDQLTVQNQRKLLGFGYGNTSIEVGGLNPDGAVIFSSNIFSSFSLSRFVITPNTIDFNRIFSNFWSFLEDSPHVFAVNLVLLFLTAIGSIFLRRVDKWDSKMWEYLPLVDNNERDDWLYTISVHSALGSPRHMTAMPFFNIMGRRATSYSRVLSDGVRENFRGGTVSNFVLKSPVWLGELAAIKIWTDGRGDQPDWKLDRLVIKDISENKHYLFVCQDWLALTKNDGTIGRTIPVTKADMITGTSGFSLVSKQKLYDDHLWLSIAKRPVYSTFTRVQRFLSAIALLFLTMITNAMFYQTGDNSDDNESQSQTSGVKFGPVEIGYREVYVSVVSAIIIIIPGFLMTWIFTHRKLRGVDYPCSKNLVDVYPHYPLQTEETMQPTSLSTSGSDKTASIFLTNSNHTNHSIGFLRVLFDEFNQRLNDFDEDEKEESFGKEDGKTDNKDQGLNSVKQPFLLPWWFIFVGYFLIFISILTSAAFTFFYSLEWGGDISLQWLVSLFFSASASAIVVEPVKILMLCLLLSCIYRQFAASDLSTVAPFDKDIPLPQPSGPVPSLAEEPDTNTKEIKKKKEELKLRQKFTQVLTSMGFQIAMVILVAIVCLHSERTLSYQQNTQIRSLLGLDFLEDSVNIQTEIYQWLHESIVINALPRTLANGQPMTAYQRKFTSDLEHYRIGPIRIMQYRITGNDCEHTSELPEYLDSLICSGNYEFDGRETRNFDQNWTLCTTTCPLKEFTYSNSDPFSLSQSGDIAWYGPGGYEAVLATGYTQALASLGQLESNGWIDRLTRGLLVEFTVFNPNTRLFTQAKVLLETPSVGSVIKTIKVESARLYPYTTVWDYLVLLFQLSFAIVVLFRLFLAISLVIKPTEGMRRCSWITVMTFVELATALTAFIVYIVRVHETIVLLERILNETGEFSSFDVVFLLDEIYTVTMSVVLFIRILLCLAPLSLNYHLYLMKETLRSAVSQLSGFATILVFALLAFSMYFSIARGTVTKNLRNVFHSFCSLLTVLLGHGKYRGIGGDNEMAEKAGLDEVVFRLMYGLFCLGSAILMLNLAITILSTYMKDVKMARMNHSGKHQGYDDKLNKFMWSKIDDMIKKIFAGVGGSGKKETNSVRDRYLKSAGMNVELDRNDEFFKSGKFSLVK